MLWNGSEEDEIVRSDWEKDESIECEDEAVTLIDKDR
jgi:hypothetical protein